jgi:hypothetical protein
MSSQILVTILGGERKAYGNVSFQHKSHSGRTECIS